MQVKTFEDLNCWKACRELRIIVTKQLNTAATPEALAGKLGLAPLNRPQVSVPDGFKCACEAEDSYQVSVDRDQAEESANR